MKINNCLTLNNINFFQIKNDPDGEQQQPVYISYAEKEAKRQREYRARRRMEHERLVKNYQNDDSYHHKYLYNLYLTACKNAFTWTNVCPN